NRQDAKVAKTNKFDVSACGAPTSGKLGVLGVLAAVKNVAYVVLQEKTMESVASPTYSHTEPFFLFVFQYAHSLAAAANACRQAGSPWKK
ncbi:MAG: hypothetical protein WCR06_05115, partial [bacterium]